MEGFIINAMFKCPLCSDRVSGKNCSPDGCQCVYHRKCLQDWLNQTEVFSCPNRKCSLPFKNVLLKKELQGTTVKTISLVQEIPECPICCESLKRPYAAPECCNHTFCQSCLEEWSRVRHVCPLDRRPFTMINILESYAGPIAQSIMPPAISNALEEDDIMAGVTCEVCNSETQEDLMLLCDNCDRGYHTFCLPVPLDSIPEGDWYCPECENNPNNNQSEENFIDDECLEGFGTSEEEEQAAESQFAELSERAQVVAETRALRNYRGSSRLASVIDSLSNRISTSRRSRRTRTERPSRQQRTVQPGPTTNAPTRSNPLSDSESDEEEIISKKKRHAIIDDESENDEIGVIDNRNVSNMSSETGDESSLESGEDDSAGYIDDTSPVRAPRTRSRAKSEEGFKDESESSDDQSSFLIEDEVSSMSGSDLSLNKIKAKHNFLEEPKKTKRRRKTRRKRKASTKAGSSPAKKKPRRTKRRRTKKKRKTRQTALGKALSNSSLKPSTTVSPPRTSGRKSSFIVGNSFALPSGKRTRITLTQPGCEDEQGDQRPNTSRQISPMKSSTSALDQQKEKGFLSRIVTAQTKLMSRSPIKTEEPERKSQNNSSSQSNSNSLWSESEIERVRRLLWDLLKSYQRECNVENSRIMIISEKCIQKIMKKPPYTITNSRATNFIKAYIDYDKKITKMNLK